MKVTQVRRFSFFGHKVAEFEETRETSPEGVYGVSPERGSKTRAIEPINPSYIAPILVEAIKRNGFPAPDKLMFVDGNELIVDGNIDAYLGVQEFKNKNLSYARVVNIIFGCSALAEAYSKEQLGTSGILFDHIRDVIEENWETVSPPPVK